MDKLEWDGGLGGIVRHYLRFVLLPRGFLVYQRIENSSRGVTRRSPRGGFNIQCRDCDNGPSIRYTSNFVRVCLVGIGIGAPCGLVYTFSNAFLALILPLIS